MTVPIVPNGKKEEKAQKKLQMIVWAKGMKFTNIVSRKHKRKSR